jgi:hypothetical protein
MSRLVKEKIMPKNIDLWEQIKEAQKSGKDLDPNMSIDPTPHPNKEFNKALGVSEDTIIKPVQMPSYQADPNEMVDLPGVGKVRRGSIKGLKQGGKISLDHCKVNTAENKNSKHKNCW